MQMWGILAGFRMYDPNGIKHQEKIEEALKAIDKLIKHYEYYHGLFVTSNQPDKVTVTKESIENLEEIKKILESWNSLV